MTNEPDWIAEINDMLITSQQFAVAENISDKNTAPDDVDTVSPEEISVPDDDLLTD